MASNSKKRRRVLRVSCILAALIIAGSSFAWFTSKDEVTNRLSASNDYGVSIVESFVPPKNWVPGQEINKDVYAVNTGNIDAFVKESISGNLTYSYEKRTNVAPTLVDKTATDDEQKKQAAELAKYVKLNAGDVTAIDGATTMEAGGFLAWTDATKTIYKLNGAIAELTTGTLENGKIKKENKTVTDENTNDVTFPYQYMVGGETYVGNELKEGAVFYKVGAVNEIDTTATDSLTMTVDYDPTAGEVNSATLTDVAESNDGVPTDNPGQVKGERWHPTETGAYVYRRSFVPARAGWKEDETGMTDEQKAANAALAPYYTYAGYYYLANEDPTKEGDYYKIVLGNDDFRTYKETGADGKEREVFDVNAKESVMGAGTTILIDPATGRITDGSVAYTFVQEEKFENVKPMLTYHNKHEDKGVAYLQAYYAAGDTEESADFLAKQAAADAAEQAAEKAYQDYLDALGQQGLAEAEFDNAVGAYNSAVSRYNQAEADWTYAKELSAASKALINAADTRGKAQEDYDNADDALNAAYEAVKKIAKEMRGDTDNAATEATSPANVGSTTNFSDLLLFGDNTDVSYNKIFKTDLTGHGLLDTLIKETTTTLDAGTVSNASVLTDLEAYRSGMETLWGAANSTDDKTIVGATKRLDNALKAFQAANFDLNSPTGADADAKAKLQELKNARKNLETLLKNYKALFTNIQGVARSEAALTEINAGVAGTNFESEIDDWIQRLADMETGINQCTDESKVGKLNISANGTVNDSTYGIDAIVRDFVIKYNNFVKEKTDKLPKAEAAWEQALRQYNTDTTAAKTKYDGKIQKNQRVEDPFKSTVGSPVYEKNDYEGLTTDGTTPATTSAVKLWLTDKSEKIVGLYAVERPSGSDPTLSSAFNGDGTVGGGGTLNDDATGKDLWRTIGSNSTMPSGAENGEGNWGYYAAGTKTVEASYNDTTNTYTKAVVADAKTNAADVKTLVQNTRLATPAYQTVQALADAIKADGALAKAKAAKTEAYDAARTTTKDAKTASDRANVASQGATAAANAAQDADASAIKINIYLDDENDKLDWTSALADGESAQVADFYYNYILEAGKTSEKLIDSVELDSSVTSKDYKNLVFDLNVALDSRQITYADDQRTITTDALAGDFGKTATVGRESTSGKGVEVTWSEGDHNLPETIYRVGTTAVTIDNANVTFTTGAGTDNEKTWKFKYKVTVDSVDYYGESNADGTTYYRLNDTTDGFSTATDKPKTVTLNVVK